MKQFPMKGQIMEQNNLSDGKPGVLSVPPPRFHAHNCQARWPASGSIVFNPPGNLPAWQIERMEIVHRACQSLKFYVERKCGVWQSARRVARRYNGRKLKSVPTRRVRLSPGSLVHHYYLWKHGGELPAALRLNYVAGKRGVNEAVLIRFLLFAANRHWKSLRVAWAAFCQRRGTCGPGKEGLRYDPLRRNLPKGYFSAINRQRGLIIKAEKEAAALRAGAIAEIRRRTQPKRPWIRKGADYQI